MDALWCSTINLDSEYSFRPDIIVRSKASARTSKNDTIAECHIRSVAEES